MTCELGQLNVEVVSRCAGVEALEDSRHKSRGNAPGRSQLSAKGSV